MPLVEYRCSECARVFERLVPRAERTDESDCPTCGRQTGKRLISVFQVAAAEDYSMPTQATGGCCGAGGCACGR
ncbi:MAG TPA: zinc ribbon domain-containing protein [Chloroflexota bacterium]